MWDYNYDYLCHWGIKGQKWGIRRFQNEDGSLTEEGIRRYRTSDPKKARKESARRTTAAAMAGAMTLKSLTDSYKNVKAANADVQALTNGMFNHIDYKMANREVVKAAGKVAVITALGVYGTLKVAEFIGEKKDEYKQNKKEKQ